MPVKQLVRGVDVPPNLRDYIANMVYVGILARMLDIDLDIIRQALDFHFKGKQKPIDLNFGVVKSAYDWAEANLKKTDPYCVEPMNATKDISWRMGIPLPPWARFMAACSLRLVPDHTCHQPGRSVDGIPADLAERSR